MLLSRRIKLPSLGQTQQATGERSSQAPGEGRYELQGQIAAGGMGTVYRVRDRVTGQLQAMKRVTEARTRQIIDAFELEYQVLASLDHPRIIRVFDYGVDASGPYYTMELLEGQDMRRAAPLLHRKACSYLRDVATSLALLHSRRLLHRDLSPSNVRVTPDGHCKLLDFGALAPFGVASNVVGTPPLIAPEALSGAALDQRTDLYALGALAYWMLTGRHAYPARAVSELPDTWSQILAPPSVHAPEIPPELDALVLSLLSRDPLARPDSAAEVISRLDVIAELDPEDSEQNDRLAQSFFTSPRFVGRVAELRELNRLTTAALRGNGGAVRVEATSGMGSTRFLEEVAVRARLAGAAVVAVDASMSRQLQGTAHALVARLFELVPELARAKAPSYRAALNLVAYNVGQMWRIPPSAADPIVPAMHGEVPRTLAELFAEVSRERPLVVLVDNVEEADDASQGLLASIALLAPNHPLLLVVAQTRRGGTEPAPIGLHALQRHTQLIELGGLSTYEMNELCRSVFGDPPNLERFAEWLQERAAGSPLHAIEICRQLLARDVIRYTSGLWTLPNERPNAEMPAALADALAIRLASLSDPARELAECLSLQRDQPTLELCELLCGDDPEPSERARELIEELGRAHVVYAARGGFRFTSSALRSAFLRDVNEERLEKHHRRLGEAFAKLAGTQDAALRIEAGLHLIEGADEMRGAEMIAAVVCNAAKFRNLVANLYHGGRPVEAALRVYRRHRRSIYERLPLMAALAFAGYYENRYFADRYGDEAIDALEEVCGLHTMRRMRRYFGNVLALMIGAFVAFVRFSLTPRATSSYTFRELYHQLFGVVTSLAGVAALSLDATRAEKVAQTLEPFAFLPERLTPVGIYQFCRGLSDIARENEVAAYGTFQTLLERFSDPSYYRALPPDGRTMYVAGVHFARGSFALFRADGSATLESANALDATGLRLYQMIASQLRVLYYAARGELAKAAPHRDQVELHAAHVGAVWQVETWEAAAMILIQGIAMSDIVSSMRIAHRLEALSRKVPSLKRYSRLAHDALVAMQLDRRYARDLQQQHAHDEPRAFIGWAATQGMLVRSYYDMGLFSEAKKVADAALAHVTDADRELVALFVPLELSAAATDAGLGHVDAGLARLDGLIARFANCDHPLLHGLLHEARAYICWEAKRVSDYERSLAEVERWFRPTGTPALIAKCERLASLSSTTKSHSFFSVRPSDVMGLDMDTVAAAAPVMDDD